MIRLKRPLVKAAKKEVKETSIPTFKIKGIMTLRFSSFQFGEFPIFSISGYEWTATYLDDHSSFGVMFYLKSKVLKPKY